MALSPTKAIQLAQRKPLKAICGNGSSAPSSSFKELFSTALLHKPTAHSSSFFKQHVSLSPQSHSTLHPSAPPPPTILEPLLPNPPFTLFTHNLIFQHLQKQKLQQAPRWKKVVPKKLKALARDASPKALSDFIARQKLLLRKAGKCFKCCHRGHLSNNCNFKRVCLGCGKPGHSLRTCSFFSFTDSPPPPTTTAVNSATPPKVIAPTSPSPLNASSPDDVGVMS